MMYTGRDPELINRIQDPSYLDRIAQTFKDVMTAVQTFTPWAGAWVGESGGAYKSGGIGVSNTFADGFWYLDQLGMTSTFNHKAYCRQALIGGNYGLIDSASFVPNPDYYGSVFSISGFCSYFLCSVYYHLLHYITLLLSVLSSGIS